MTLSFKFFFSSLKTILAHSLQKGKEQHSRLLPEKLPVEKRQKPLRSSSPLVYFESVCCLVPRSYLRFTPGKSKLLFCSSRWQRRRHDTWRWNYIFIDAVAFSCFGGGMGNGGIMYLFSVNLAYHQCLFVYLFLSSVKWEASRSWLFFSSLIVQATNAEKMV